MRPHYYMLPSAVHAWGFALVAFIFVFRILVAVVWWTVVLCPVSRFNLSPASGYICCMFTPGQ